MDPSTESNYYEILGVTPQANENEIVSAWRKTALKLHPDKNLYKFAAQNRRNTETEEEHKTRVRALYNEAEKAYHTLSSPEERAKYDARLRLADQPANPDRVEQRLAETSTSSAPGLTENHREFSNVYGRPGWTNDEHGWGKLSSTQGKFILSSLIAKEYHPYESIQSWAETMGITKKELIDWLELEMEPPASDFRHPGNPKPVRWADYDEYLKNHPEWPTKPRISEKDSPGIIKPVSVIKNNIRRLQDMSPQNQLGQWVKLEKKLTSSRLNQVKKALQTTLSNMNPFKKLEQSQVELGSSLYHPTSREDRRVSVLRWQ